MPRPPSDAVQVALRVPGGWLGEADKLAKLISRPGFEASRTDAFRAAIARGFAELFRELKQPTTEEELAAAIVDRVARFDEKMGGAMPSDGLLQWADTLSMPGVPFILQPTLAKLVKDGRLVRKDRAYAIGKAHKGNK
jgi:hypothetical protein